MADEQGRFLIDRRYMGMFSRLHSVMKVTIVAHDSLSINQVHTFDALSDSFMSEELGREEKKRKLDLDTKHNTKDK